MTVLDDIINKRKVKIIKLQEQIVSLDKELMEMYKELEYFEEKRSCDL